MVTKAILAKELKKSGLSYRDAVQHIDVLFDSMKTQLSHDRRIEIRGFGTFYVGRRAARKTSINGQMAVPEHGKVVFRPCEKLRRAVWNCGKEKKE